MTPQILYSDKHIVVAVKPQGMPSQPDKTGDEDMQSFLSKSFGNLGLLHRLDRPVGGILLFTRTQQALARLSSDLQNGLIEKNYIAVVCGKPEKDSARLIGWLLKDGRTNMSKSVAKGTAGAKEAVLEYRLMETVKTEDGGCLSMLEIKLFTGRHHQIRVQLSNIGAPIFGDTKYGKKPRSAGYIPTALFACELSFIHPYTNKKMRFEKIPEGYPFDLFSYQR